MLSALATGWIFSGILLGSIVTSSHDTEEACRGRASMLRDKGVVGDCHRLPGTSGSFITYGGPTTIMPVSPK